MLCGKKNSGEKLYNLCKMENIKDSAEKPSSVTSSAEVVCGTDGAGVIRDTGTDGSTAGNDYLTVEDLESSARTTPTTQSSTSTGM